MWSRELSTRSVRSLPPTRSVGGGGRGEGGLVSGVAEPADRATLAPAPPLPPHTRAAVGAERGGGWLSAGFASSPPTPNPSPPLRWGRGAGSAEHCPPFFSISSVSVATTPRFASSVPMLMRSAFGR